MRLGDRISKFQKAKKIEFHYELSLSSVTPLQETTRLPIVPGECGKKIASQIQVRFPIHCGASVKGAVRSERRPARWPCSFATAFEEPYGSAKRPGLESEERRSPVPFSRMGTHRLLLTSLLLQNGTYTFSGIICTLREETTGPEI